VENSLLHKLGNKEITKTQLLLMAESDSNLVPLLLEGTNSDRASVRYGCGYVLTNLSEKHPDKLYQYMDKFIGLLGSQHRILTWNALAIIANLTAVDGDGKFESIFDKYYSFLGNEYMVTVANVVANSTIIGSNKLCLADRIAAKLLKVQNLKTTPHLTEECKLVIAEKAIQTFDALNKNADDKRQLLVFARKYTNCSRDSLKMEAQNFLKKWS